MEVKRADRPYAAGISPELADASNDAKAEALRRAVRAGMIGLLGGAGVAALFGVRGSEPPNYPSRAEIDLPYPQPVGRRKRASLGGAITDAVVNTGVGAGIFSYVGDRYGEDPGQGRRHGAVRGSVLGLLGATPGGLAGQTLFDRLAPAARANPSFARSLARWLARTASKATGAAAGVTAAIAPSKHVADRLVGEMKYKKQADLADLVVRHTPLGTPAGAAAPTPLVSPAWYRGDTHTDPGGVPWATPAAAAAGVGGVVGGAALVRHLLKRRAKARLQSELEAARREYEEAMLGQYDPAKLRRLGLPKAASALDVCYRQFVKDAGLLDDLLRLRLNNPAGHAAGLYLLGAGSLGAATAVGMKRWLDSRDKRKLLADALKRRALARSMSNPAEVSVRPVPVEYEDVEEGRGDAG